MIIATYLVKNDHDILENSIVHHLNNGVDAIIVTENNASDPTISILDKYNDHIILRIKQEADDYQQFKWVNHMAQAAIEYKPDWIIHCDADELWHGLESLHSESELALYTQYWYNFLPYSREEFEIDKAIYYEHVSDVPDDQDTNKTWFDNIYSCRKIIHKPTNSHYIGMGNHNIFSMVDNRQLDDLNASYVKIFHYPIRTYAQFEEKVISGGRALMMSAQPSNVGWHWRKWYNDYKDGKLPEVYSSYMATYENIKDIRNIGKIKLNGVMMS